MSSALQRGLRLAVPVVIGLFLAGCGEPNASPDAVRVGQAEQARTVNKPSGAGRQVIRGKPVPRSDPGPVPFGSTGRGCSGTRLEPAAANLTAVVRATICLLNVERISRGMRPLHANRSLARAALQHSKDMVRRSYFAHDSLTGETFVARIRATGYFGRACAWMAGENLAWGTGILATPGKIVPAWMTSPGHRANVLERKFATSESASCSERRRAGSAAAPPTAARTGPVREQQGSGAPGMWLSIRTGAKRGQAIHVSGGLGPGSGSPVHRRLRRSVRTETVFAAAVFATAGVFGGLFATGVISSRGQGESATVEQVVRSAAESTVLIEARRASVRVESGTGWVLDAGQGLIVTNAHVVNGGRTFRIGAENGFRPARVLGVAPCEDLAVLRVRDTRGLRSLSLGRQSELELGQTVVAVGYPANASAESSLTSTTGVVSVARTAFREAALDIPRYPNVIQTDAAINPGNSGGPLLDLSGRLIGVNTAGRTIAPDGRIVQGQNYAIGVDRVREITTILRTGRSLGWTGLSFKYPTAQQLREGHLPVGLLAGTAVPGTGAAKAGLGRAGVIILAVDGMRLDHSLASYCDAVGGSTSGQKVTFTLLEPGSTKLRRVTVPVA